ncbi:MAG: tetratricopeptide repeat protein [Treponema sp.]|jgi:tetratricopeptide (TPR) repeat protein|nr:tetratricopeptide repeat protein [Treponema sp.]
MKLPLAAILCGLVLASCFAGPNDKTLVRYALARNAYQEGNFSETLEILEGIRNFAPALALRGKAEYFQGNLDAAETAFRQARKLNPSFAEAGLYLGRCLREKGDRAAAEALVESLLAVDPLNVRFLRLAADLAREGGREDSALSYLDQAVEASAETAMVFVDRARARWIAGKGTEALEDLTKAQTLLPWNTPLSRSIQNLERSIREVSP